MGERHTWGMPVEDSVRLVTLHTLEQKDEGSLHDGAPVYASPVSARRAGADRVRVWSGRSVVPNGTAHQSPDRWQAAWREKRTMRQHGSIQSGKQALSFAVLLAQKVAMLNELSRESRDG